MTAVLLVAQAKGYDVTSLVDLLFAAEKGVVMGINKQRDEE
ncbi:MAG: hypothetical protein ABT940_07260 [Alphaproteobacteria bacterium]